jgi:hypothetical protein
MPGVAVRMMTAVANLDWGVEQSMYRFRYGLQVRYGHFNDFFANQQQQNELARSRGWPEATFWVPATGAVNTFIGEIEYPDLATYQRLNEMFRADGEAMALYRAANDHIVEGSAYTELFETPPQLA